MHMDRKYYEVIQRRLKQSGEWRFARGCPSHPPFRGAERAAQRLLAALPHARTLLVMRDAVLRPVREAVLDAGLTLVVPDKLGDEAWSIPPQALLDSEGKRQPLKIDPLPSSARLYSGLVDVVVTGCLAFDPAESCLYGFDSERTAGILDSLRDGTEGGFRLQDSVPVIAIAADCQQVSGWALAARSYVCSQAVATPTRFVLLGQDGPARRM